MKTLRRTGQKRIYVFIGEWVMRVTGTFGENKREYVNGDDVVENRRMTTSKR